MEAQKDILWRVYLVYILAFLFSIVIIAKVATIQFKEGDMWRERAQKLQVMDVNIEAVRGNIYANDGSLMATSVPFYEIRMDVNADPITNKIFNENVDSLAFYLSELFGDKTQKDYRTELRKARSKGERYHFIQKNVRYNQLKQLKKFPMFRLGKYKGGLIYLQQNRRELPFRSLAARTIGYDRVAQKPVGIEGAYNNYLKGVGGKRLMQKIAGNVWMPINDENEIEPKNGSDIYTSIDVNIQDVAQSALQKQLILQNADHGCLALMEVNTGQIKAIVNLSRTDSGSYAEQYNYIIGESTEPGSTFKLASLMVAMEDGFADLDDMIDTEGGKIKFYNQTIHDSHEGGYGKISVKQVFEKSSNVGVAKLIVKSYGKNPQKFIDGLYAMSIHKALNLEIPGEGKPRIKSTKEKDWSGVSLPQMAYGYETKMTPLQILTFYNAVANDGVMVKPQFVKEIRNNGTIEIVRQPEIINKAICSKSTIKKAKKMLEGVVENGTATNLRNTPYKIAAKTGTAQLANGKYGYKYKEKVSYQASLAGYFPAENPKYSMIIVINAPSNKVYYGNDVAGPIFREVADKVYSTSMEIHKELTRDSSYKKMRTPIAKSGMRQDIEMIAEKLSLQTSVDSKSSDWVYCKKDEQKIAMISNVIKSNTVPNIIGMGLKDAIYILENNGMNVSIYGSGKVINQAPAAGTKISKGTTVLIELM